MHRSIRHVVTTHKLMPTVHIDMVLVTVVALAMLLGPPGIRIFLAELGRFIHPALRCLTGFDLCILITLVVLGGNGNDGCVDDLSTHRQITSVFQIAVEVLEHRRDHASLRQLLSVQPHRLGIGNFVLKA